MKLTYSNKAINFLDNEGNQKFICDVILRNVDT